MTIRSLTRTAAFAAAHFVGLSLLFRKKQKGRLTVICLHNPSPRHFERIVDVLSRYYRLVGIGSWLDRDLGEQVDDRPMLAITLDDGHRGNFRLLDIIGEKNIPVTIFLCSRIVGTNCHYWWTHADASVIPELKRQPNDVRLSRLSCAGFTQEQEYGDRQALSWEEIEQMSAAVDFQAHTRTHPILPTCDDSTAISEILGSKQDLERKGIEVQGFAFTNGDYSDRDVELVHKAGYRYAMTLDSGSNDLTSDNLKLKRTVVDDDVANIELLVKTSGAWDKLMVLIGRKKSYGYQDLGVAGR